MLAASIGHLPLLKKLLNTWGAKATPTDKSGCTALHHAARGGYTEAISMLIEDGRDLDPVANNGYTPFLMAVLDNHCETARILLQAGCDLLAKNSFVDYLAIRVANLYMFEVLSHYGRWKGGLVKRHSASPALCELAVENRKPDVVRWLTKAGLPFKPLPDMLFRAVEKSDIDMARLLLEYGLPPDGTNAEGRTALWKAVESGSTAIVHSLLCKGADMFSKSHPELLLLRAIRTGNATLVSRLLQGGQQATSITPPLFLAAQLGHQEIAGRLLDAGFAHETPDRARTAAMTATEHGHVGVVRLLHDRGVGGDHDQRRLQLLRAIERRHAPVVGMLLEKVGRLDAEIESCAASCMPQNGPQSLDIIDLLLAKKYPVEPGNPASLKAGHGRARDFQAFSGAMLEAATIPDADAQARMRELGIRSANWSALLALARTVIKLGPKLTVEGASEQHQQGAAFGLLLAAMAANEGPLELNDEFDLVENARSQKRAPGLAGQAHFDAICSGCIGNLVTLGLARSNAHLETKGLAKTLNERGALLLRANAAIDQAGPDGATALHCAAMHGHTATVALLLRRGASQEQVDRQGHNAASLAAQHGHRQTAKAMHEHALRRAAGTDRLQEVQALAQLDIDINAIDAQVLSHPPETVTGRCTSGRFP